MNIYKEVKSWQRVEGVELFKDLGLNDNPLILDYGCGYGHYTFPAARALNYKGTVFAVDIDTKCLHYVKETAADENLSNIKVSLANTNYTLNFSNESLDMILYYDLFHGNGYHRFTLLKEAKRTLKYNGILSILPFHLSNFKDKNGFIREYSYDEIIKEILEYGFIRLNTQPKIGIHFDKYPIPTYISNNDIDFQELERGEILTFIKK